jgi:hypothetical protein
LIPCLGKDPEKLSEGPQVEAMLRIVAFEKLNLRFIETGMTKDFVFLAQTKSEWHGHTLILVRYYKHIAPIGALEIGVVSIKIPLLSN